jgi:hypothetical protein
MLVSKIFTFFGGKMSYRFNFDVFKNGKVIKQNESIGTVSINEDMTSRDTYLRFFNYAFSILTEETILKFCPWFKEFDKISVRHWTDSKHIFHFNRSELIES